MSAANHRIQELRRRVQSDPAPFVFAQLAEEYRRAGRFDEAITTCRTGLERHPAYLSARLILGRSLAALSRWDEAARELETVIAHAPDNLAATRELADICQRQGRLSAALDYYRRALALAGNDRVLEDSIKALEAECQTPPETGDAHQVGTGATAKVDFDALLATLGRPGQPAPPLIDALLTDPDRLRAPDEATHDADGTRDSDPLATLESRLRRYGEGSPIDSTTASLPAAADVSIADFASGVDHDATSAAILTELEAWLRALDADRGRSGTR